MLSGHSDVAIGTRLARGARVVRGPRREFISRGYNLLPQAARGARFSDAQRGFKAIRRESAAQLLPQTTDSAWFFDTELLVLAERAGLRIHEVPVDWIDDPDSRVDVRATAVADIRGIVRMGGRHRLLRFLVVGVASTATYVVLYLWLRQLMAAQAANAVSLLPKARLAAATAVTTIWSYALLNRTPDWLPALRYVVLIAGLGAADAFLIADRLGASAAVGPTGTVQAGAAVAGCTRRGALMSAAIAISAAAPAGRACPVARARVRGPASRPAVPARARAVPELAVRARDEADSAHRSPAAWPAAPARGWRARRLYHRQQRAQEAAGAQLGRLHLGRGHGRLGERRRSS